MIDPEIDIDSIDITKLDFALDIRHLSREIILTAKIHDDKLFKTLSDEAQPLFKQLMDELLKAKKIYTQLQKP